MNISYKLIQAILLVVFSINTSHLKAQSLSCDSFQLQFIKSFGGSKSEVAYGITATNDGGTISIGHSLSRDGDVDNHFFNTDYWVVKTDGQGNVEWNRSYGGSSSDAGKSIIQDSDGNFLLCGESVSMNGDLTGATNGSLDFWIVKIDALGEIIWQNIYGGSDVDNAYSIIESTNGGYVVYGSTESSDIDVLKNKGMSDVWILKIDKNGLVEWSKTLGGSQNDYAIQIIQSSDGGYLGIGNTHSNDGDVNSNIGDSDAMIFKIDENGNLLWMKTMGGTNKDDIHSISNTYDGKIIISGTTLSNDGLFSSSNGNLDAWAAKLDANGNIIWANTYGGSQDDGAFGIVESPFGGFFFSCFSKSKNGIFDSNKGVYDNWFIHLNKLGEIDWKHAYGGSSSEQIKFMTLQGNDLLLCGYTESDDDESGTNKGGSDFYLMRFATDDYPLSNLKTSEIVCEGESVEFNATAIDCGSCDYSWDDGNTTAVRSIVANQSKKYTVTISNSSGCSIQKSIDILVSNLEILPEIIQPNQCGRLASVDLIPSGQIGIPDFLWEDGSTLNNRINLLEGDYQVTISDDVCSIISNFTIQKTGEIPELNLGVIQQVCGKTTLELDASNPNATYLWSTGSTNPTISVDQSDTYSITVTSAEGCTIVDSIQVIIQENPNLDLGEDFSTCAAFDLSTNLNDMVFNWSTGANTSSIFIENSGNYSVTVTNGLGCSSQDTIQIEMSGDLNIELGENTTSCEDIYLNSGLSNANYNWSTGDSSQILKVTESGIYSITVTDNIGCSDTDTVSITILPKIEVRLGDNKAVCGPRFQKANVEAETYLWSTGEITPEIWIENSGDYSLTVTNSAGCSAIDEITYVIKPIPQSTLNDSIYSCSPIEITPGLGQYNYLWDDGQYSPSILIEETGTYIVTITSSGGCKLADTSFVSINEDLEIAESVNHISCYNANDGIISVLALGGKKPITYNWGVQGNSGSIQNLREGFYTLSVTDSEGCTTVKSYKIHNPNQILVEFETTGFDCDGDEGELFAEVHGGTGEHFIKWDNGEISNPIQIDESKWYFISVTDDNECQVEDSILVMPSNPIVVDTAFIIDNICEGKSTGSIEVDISGGKEPHQYNWSNGSNNTNKLSNLSEGTYVLTILDPNGCSEVFSFDVNSLPSLDAKIKGINNCGEKTSWAFIQPIGGTPPYNFSWNTGDTTNQISNLEDGLYEITVTDANGCEQIDEIGIINYPELIVNSNLSSVTCFGAMDGKIEIDILSGTPPYLYDWSNEIVGENEINNLDTGNYTIYINDKNGCSIFESIEISQPEKLNTEVITENPTTGNNGKIEIKPLGGTPPFNLVWDNGETTMIRENLSIGIYSYDLTDANDCIFEGKVDLGVTANNNFSIIHNFSVSPNPNHGIFTISMESNHSIEGQISITNLLGESIWSSSVSGNKIDIPVELNQFANGVYFVNFRGKFGVWGLVRMVVL